MVRNYVRKGKRCRWSLEQLTNAISDVHNKVYSVRVASKSYGILRSTLQDALAAPSNKEPGKIGRRPTLGVEYEAQLKECALKMSDLYYCITRQQLRKLAYDLAQVNGLARCFSEVTKVAGYDWFNVFMRRNPGLSMRVPESTSVSRVIGFRRSEINCFFENLMLALAGVDPSRLFNVGETGLSTVQSQKERVLSHKGRKQIGQMVSAEKGEIVTAVCCISATGVFIPPMLIFPGARINDRLAHGAPPGTIIKCSSSGWINSALFVDWLTHFVASTGATPEKKTVLLLDNHESHVSLEAYELCRKHGVTMVSFAPHTPHRCQPLDLTVYGSLKTTHSKRCAEWMATHPSKRITQYEVAELFGDAYNKIASVDKCVSSFRTSGCWPLNSNIFEDHDFSV
jgi:hypothetical protein